MFSIVVSMLLPVRSVHKIKCIGMDVNLSEFISGVKCKALKDLLIKIFLEHSVISAKPKWCKIVEFRANYIVKIIA